MEMVNNGKHVLAGDYHGVGEDYNSDTGDADEKTNKKKVIYLVILSHELE